MELQTQTHLAALRDQLTYRLSELLADIHAAELAAHEGSATATPEVRDRKDEAAQSALSDVGDAEQRRDIEELERVQAALRRLDAGVYGDCVDCAEPIPLARLRVQPAAERCAACQARHETQRGRDSA
jgi:DnaK suppressor protein